MIYFKKYIFAFFILLVLMMFIKSMSNALRFTKELGKQPEKINIKICPKKTEKDFNKFKDKGYLFALYRYKSMGEKCKN